MARFYNGQEFRFMGTDKKINVCHLISGDLWAGAEVQMFTVVTALNKAPELNVSAIVLNEGKLVSKLRKVGIEVKVIDESQYGFLQILRQAKKYLGGKNIDILHTHRYKENVIGALLKKGGSVRYIVQTVHGINEPLKWFKALKAKLYSSVNLYYTRKYFDKILAVSDDIRNTLGKKVDSDKLDTIHNAINPANIRITDTTEKIKHDLGINSIEHIIGSAGRMVPVKGYSVFLDMAKIILAKIPGTMFLLVGDGPLMEELKIKARRMGIGDQVLFLGFRNDIIDIINCLDIFVISSYHEGIPMALLEAMALKKAVVATAVGGINEIIENDISGLLVAPGGARSLADSCIKVLNDIGVKERLGAEAVKRINNEFVYDIQRDRIIDVYNELMKRA